VTTVRIYAVPSACPDLVITLLQPYEQSLTQLAHLRTQEAAEEERSVYVHTRMLSADFMCLLGRRDKCDKTCYHPVTRFLTLSEIMKKSNEERKKKREERKKGGNFV
jgi:hypothetical protein